MFFNFRVKGNQHLYVLLAINAVQVVTTQLAKRFEQPQKYFRLSIFP